VLLVAVAISPRAGIALQVLTNVFVMRLDQPQQPPPATINDVVSVPIPLRGSNF
jgi:hypothetical protein